MTTSDRKTMRVAFQGEPGAFSEAAAIQLLGNAIRTVPRATFEAAFTAIGEGSADALLAVRRFPIYVPWPPIQWPWRSASVFSPLIRNGSASPPKTPLAAGAKPCLAETNPAPQSLGDAPRSTITV